MGWSASKYSTFGASPVTRHLELRVLEGHFAVARLEPNAAIPDWVAGEVVCIARTPTELSIVCANDQVPDSVRSNRPWSCLEVAGPLDFSETGILSALTATLADAGVSVFAISTFDTDYLLVREETLVAALASLEGVGHHIARPRS